MATKMWLWEYSHSFGATALGNEQAGVVYGFIHPDPAGGNPEFFYPLDSSGQDSSTGFFRTISASTAAGPTAGKSFGVGWYSRPLDADVTISGTITFNFWMLENNMSANVSAACAIYRIQPDGTWTQIIQSAKGVELGTTAAVQNWTATPTSTAFKKGDRILVMPLGDDAGTMAALFTYSIDFAFGTAVDGDSWVQFTETLTFQSTAPAGTILYMTDAASDINPGAATALEAWSSPGSALNSDTNATAGPVAGGIQITDTGGGTALEWYTKKLNGFTLAGGVNCSVNLKMQAFGGGFTSGSCTIRFEIAVCDADGSNAVLWGTAQHTTPDSVSSSHHEKRPPDATAATYSFWVVGYDTAVSSGQRLRIRLILDDPVSFFNINMRSGDVARVAYGNSATSVRLTQSVTEFRLPPRPIRVVSQAVQRAVA